MKERETNGWNDQWEVSFCRSKADLKMAKVGQPYSHSFAISKSSLRKLTRMLKDTIQRPTSSRYSFETNTDDSEQIFGGQYFSKMNNNDRVFVDPIQATFTIDG
eukprot:827704_1